MKHADIAVFFLGSADSQQVTLELKSLLASDACTKAALICTGQQGRCVHVILRCLLLSNIITVVFFLEYLKFTLPK